MIDTGSRFFCRLPFSLMGEGWSEARDRGVFVYLPRKRKVHSMHRREWLRVAGNFFGWSKTMSTNAGFWSRFEERVAPFNLLQHPFYQAWSKGELTREDLREYAAEYWHHVSAFPTYLSALHSRLPDGEMRREVLRNLAEEEGVDSATARPHSDLWMDFAEGMGASRDEVAGRAVQPEMTALVATFRELMQEGTASSAMAALYAYESKVPAIAATKVEGLAEHYETEGAAARYFTLHQTADVAHASVWRELIDKELAARSAEDEEAALNAGERAAKALWFALDGVERRRLAVN
jgi:pyrroloquinoline-quinone synthase